MNAMRDKLMGLSRWAVIAMLFFASWRLEWPIALSGFDPAGGSVVADRPGLHPVDLLALVAVVSYALAGWPGRRRLWAANVRVWPASLVGLTVWAIVSIAWAERAGLAAAFAIRLALWVLLALRVACDDLPLRSIALSMFAGLLLNAVIGAGQVLAQRNLGLAALGELPIDTSYPGVSVIGPDDAHLIRLYGLSGHPNVIGGYAAIALLLTAGRAAPSPRRKSIGVAAWAIGWVALLLTFSRSALIGFLVGSAVILVWKGRPFDLRRSIPLAAVMSAVALVLFAALGPTVVDRVIVSGSTVEQSSIRERIDLSALAVAMIEARPVLGVGIGNFRIASIGWTSPPIYADWVHNVPLLVASELGLVGLVVWLIGIGALIGSGIERLRSSRFDTDSARVAGAIAAMLTIMLFDHYGWTSSQSVYVWGGLTGWWIGTSRRPA